MRELSMDKCVAISLIVSFAAMTPANCKTKKSERHPPIWEYTYQYELFEKIYEQTQGIQKQLRRLNYGPGKCPRHWTLGPDSCYFLPLHRKLDWFSAQECCERLGGHLTIIETEAEDTFVSNFLKEESENKTMVALDYVWIGGFDYHEEGDWMWVNGQRISYSNWRMTEDELTEMPRNSRENCLDYSGGWNDNKCSNKFHFLCETEILF